MTADFIRAEHFMVRFPPSTPWRKKERIEI